MDGATPVPSSSNSSSSPTIAIVFAGIFGTIVLCAALYTADWYFRRHKIGQLHANYGFQNGGTGHSNVRGFGLLSETQAVGDYVKDREGKGAAKYIEDPLRREAGGRDDEIRHVDSTETTESEESTSNTESSISRTHPRHRGLGLPRVPPPIRRTARQAIAHDKYDVDGTDAVLAPQAKLVPHYVAANMNWAYQKGYGDAARWLDIEKVQNDANQATEWEQQPEQNGYWQNNGWPQAEQNLNYDYGARRAPPRGGRKQDFGKSRGTGDDERRRDMTMGRQGRVPPRRAWLKNNGGGRVLGEI